MSTTARRAMLREMNKIDFRTRQVAAMNMRKPILPSILAGFCMLALAACDSAATLDQADAGLSSEKLDRLGDEIVEWVAAGELVGAELLIVKDGRSVFHEASRRGAR